ncbi:hypothetical protein, partial [Vibrio cholerae]|uniref:hypothetical protein n=1 Tax=Vibrio cholerae TaxID=666 RepID=UPI003F64AB9A
PCHAAHSVANKSVGADLTLKALSSELSKLGFSRSFTTDLAGSPKFNNFPLVKQTRWLGAIGVVETHFPVNMEVIQALF